MEEEDGGSDGLNKQILIQFVNHENKSTGPVINVPLSITKDNLDELINDLKAKNDHPIQDDDHQSLNYSFMINDKLPIKNNLYDAIKNNTISSEDILRIKYFPLNLFKIKRITTCNSTLPGHTNSILCLAFSPNSSHLATGSGDNTVRLWDINTQTPIATLKDHTNWVLSVLFSPDNHFLATAGMDQNVFIYETHTGKLVNKLSGHKKEVTTLCFEPLHLLNRNCIQRSAPEVRKRKKENETGKETGKEERNGAKRGKPNAEAELEASSGGPPNGEAKQNKRKKGDEGEVTGDQCGPNSANDEGDPPKSGNDGEAPPKGDNDGEAPSEEAPSKGAYFLKCRLASAGKDGCIRINNVLSNCVEKVLTGHTNTITCILWSGADEQNSRLYSSSRDTTIKVWNPNEGTLLHNFKGHKHWVNCLSINTERIIKNGIYNLDVVINKMHIENHIEKSKRIFKNFFQTIPNEKVVSGSDDGTLYLLECLPNDEFKSTRLVGHQKTVIHAQFSPDGKFIASCSFDNSVRVWSGIDGQFLTVYRGHVGPVYKVVWSIDSNYVVSCSQDSTLKLWKVSHLLSQLKKKKLTPPGEEDATVPSSGTSKEGDGKNDSKNQNGKDSSNGKNSKKVKTLLVDLPGHSDAVYAIDWSNDGKYVASGGKDKLLKIWSS
ncbi:ribosome assembly protein 4, putative [Plasmodium vivax]|uniref:WD domain, G-beta repeat domain containing protein n=6 Tax=Plasmodium vivax TaxID=5855 RepID=A5K5B7_PLAVS|nr:WD domain, G-beta repeat domain containing protein [Plasmodium vivax]KMZ82341.1 WD domain, G-beta repeat domain-containing protein [Plasmodium vivax India VII]KMZ86444.1 WD domain, G-beta repeat domain-containing protein [Plasmodium vivax Brazil I]KMZ92864.1 WD domain, G-beta repeat domain-containing protein [Plasmodium vivax Mauritania I]KMZ99377.1 WD domain, G-beta repeat domain-containing protein [Plasmodium vivax North Korean]EDL45845.1 WD domain, G-beta repeat domain containing protein|eukprot:XP_001615572.1 WD domain, G-beta repeat domain containing protein [Plasmodium vivax Sal-1]